MATNGEQKLVLSIMAEHSKKLDRLQEDLSTLSTSAAVISDREGRATRSTTSATVASAHSRFVAAAGGPKILMLKSRNATIGSKTIVADNDTLGTVMWMADDGVDYATRCASLYAEVDDGSPAENAIGGAVVFKTATTGGTLTEALRISSAQDMTLAGDITVSGTGPHAIGGSVLGYVRLGLTG